jgi:hypothetical protein
MPVLRSPTCITWATTTPSTAEPSWLAIISIIVQIDRRIIHACWSVYKLPLNSVHIHLISAIAGCPSHVCAVIVAHITLCYHSNLVTTFSFVPPDSLHPHLLPFVCRLLHSHVIMDHCQQSGTPTYRYMFNHTFEVSGAMFASLIFLYAVFLGMLWMGSVTAIELWIVLGWISSKQVPTTRSVRGMCATARNCPSCLVRRRRLIWRFRPTRCSSRTVSCNTGATMLGAVCDLISSLVIRHDDASYFRKS